MGINSTGKLVLHTGSFTSGAAKFISVCSSLPFRWQIREMETAKKGGEKIQSSCRSFITGKQMHAPELFSANLGSLMVPSRVLSLYHWLTQCLDAMVWLSSFSAGAVALPIPALCSFADIYFAILPYWVHWLWNYYCQLSISRSDKLSTATARCTEEYGRTVRIPYNHVHTFM